MRLPASQRRQAIVQAAIRLFSDKGFRGTTTRQLAAAVGVSEPVIYQHFATKQDLYAAIIESKSGEVKAELSCWTEGVSADDRTVFLELGQMIWRWFEDDRTLTRLLFFSALEGNELADMFFTRNAAGFHEAVSGYIKTRIGVGAFRAVDADTLAWAFIGMVAHHAEAVSVFRFDPKPRPREAMLADMVELYLRGVLVKVPKGFQHVKSDKQMANRNSTQRPVDRRRGGVRKKG